MSGLAPCGGMGFCCLADFGRSAASRFGGAVVVLIMIGLMAKKK